MESRYHNLVSKFQDTVATLKDWNSLSQERLTELASDFGATWDEVQPAYNFVRALNPDTLLDMPYQTAAECTSKVQELVRTLSQILDFNVRSHQNHQEAVGRLIQQLRTLFNSLYRDISPAIGMHLRAELNPSKERYTSALNELRNDAESKVKDISLYRDAAKQAVADTGSIAYAKVFQDESDRYYSDSKIWLCALCMVGGIGVLGIVAYLYFDIITDLAPTSLVNWLGFKLFLVSIFYVAVAFCIKNYSATRHNAVLNKHRAAAMLTFQAFAAGAKSDETKDAVLRQATEAIFVMHRTGYDHKDSSTNPMQQVMKVIADRTPSDKQ